MEERELPVSRTVLTNSALVESWCFVRTLSLCSLNFLGLFLQIVSRSTTAELSRVKRHKFPDTHRRTAGHSLHAVRQSVVPTSPVQFAHRQDMTGEVLRHSKPFQLAFEILGGECPSK